DLVVLRHIGIEVVLPVEDRVRRYLAIKCQPDLDDPFEGLAVGNRQGTWVPHADRAYVRVRVGSESVQAAAEHLGSSVQLDVALEPYDCFPPGHGALA